MSTALRLISLFALLALCVLAGIPTFGQSETATLSGVIQDPRGGAVPDVEVTATRIETGTAATAKTNGAGVYFFTGLVPGHYHLAVRKPGFKEIAIKEFELHVQDKLEQNFSLEIGSVSESVTVNASDVQINTQDASVSTVIDRNFADRIPLNGRSFQTLIELTPGVVVTPTGVSDAGQFSVNGQRGSSNYWSVDGVSANVGISATNVPGNGLGGALGAFSAQGGTNSLVSVDALQEFRIQTSTYAPEFGRTPGAQISILTRSGTNQFHGSLFDYLRNDVFDANDWFANNAKQPKPRERQNDFGGTFGGQIIKDRTFFFFSYEGLRLQLPQTALTTVPCDNTCQVFGNARAMAVSQIQPFLNAYPLPNGPEVFTLCTPNVNGCPASGQRPTGSAQLNASFSNASNLDATSLRIDQKLTDKLNVFGRYNYSPSEILARGINAAPLSVVTPTKIRLRTATAGATWAASSSLTDDLRVNYSSTRSSASSFVDNFGGATPPSQLPFPSPFTAEDGTLILDIVGLKNLQLVDGAGQVNVQRQVNLVDGLSLQRGRHSIKLGFDYRRLSPDVNRESYLQGAFFLNVAAAAKGSPFLSEVESIASSKLLFRELGTYAQDTWRATDKLSVTYGIRWDVDFLPQSRGGASFPAVTGFNVNDLSNLGLAPAGTPLFQTTFRNFAPRIGLAHRLLTKHDWQTVVRGGFGVFYDLASAQEGTVTGVTYPFIGLRISRGGTFPFSPTTAAPVPITASSLCCSSILPAFDPNLQLPYTLQWNVALEQALGHNQSLSASYVGAAGRRLLQSAFLFNPNPNIFEAELVTNAATSDYDALQLHFNRRLTHGLQSVMSYTWAHSIDTGSAGSIGSDSNTFVPGLAARANRGPSDFDIRHSFSAGFMYDFPAAHISRPLKAILGNWSAQSFITAFTAPPVDLSYGDFNFGGLLNSKAAVRPDLVPGQPLYLSGSQCVAVLGPPCAGGRGLNPAAFTMPPVDPSTGNPIRQGNLGRNALRGFGAFQWDLGIRREFPINEHMKVEFRAELFNVLNHPNFGPPLSDLSSGGFGQAQATLGQSLSGAGLAGNTGNGSFSPLYQIGGPRSGQFALKLSF